MIQQCSKTLQGEGDSLFDCSSPGTHQPDKITPIHNMHLNSNTDDAHFDITSQLGQNTTAGL